MKKVTCAAGAQLEPLDRPLRALRRPLVLVCGQARLPPCRDARRLPKSSTSWVASYDTTRHSRRSRGAVTPADRELSRHEWQIDSPVLLTRAQAAQLCQVSEEILDQW
jgi:hypothetical protein